MKGHKINLTPYDYEESFLEADGTESRRKKTRYIKYELPRILCNPNLKKNTGKTEVDPEYSLMEIGAVCQKIEQEKEFWLILSKEEIKILENRIKTVSKFFGFNHYEMFRRVTEAEEVELKERQG